MCTELLLMVMVFNEEMWIRLQVFPLFLCLFLFLFLLALTPCLAPLALALAACFT